MSIYMLTKLHPVGDYYIFNSITKIRQIGVLKEFSITKQRSNYRFQWYESNWVYKLSLEAYVQIPLLIALKIFEVFPEKLVANVIRVPPCSHTTTLNILKWFLLL